MIIENTSTLEEMRQYLDDYYLDSPLVATLSFDRTQKFYGPFANGAEAFDWFTKYVPAGVHISWSGLRNPYIARTSSDFYLPIRLENQDREYDHTTKETANDISSTR
jgi:hypothetical protein